VNASYPQLLRQATLPGPETSFRTAPRLWRVSGNHLHAQLFHGPPHLRKPLLVNRFRLVLPRTFPGTMFYFAIVASNRGAKGCLWFGIGALLGPIGFALAFTTGAKCSRCASRVSQDALVCPKCGQEFASTIESETMRPPPGKLQLWFQYRRPCKSSLVLLNWAEHIFSA
jgi:hypothetical protein